MVYQDREIGRLVDRLKRRGEWDRTLFIVAADHSHVSAGLPFFDPEAPPWESPVLASQKSRIPMIFVWPGRIPAGRRLPEAVSMIDLLPTVLELAGLPRSGTMQGRSFAPLLLGRRGWKPSPVILDEFYSNGEDLFGAIEIVDGRYGASLWIDPRPGGQAAKPDRLRPAPLLVFDVREDPHALRSLHAERPDLVAKYSKLLGRLWKENLALSRKFTRVGKIPMTREEAERLRSLGYLR
jgi:arylsulfatase A-like enzyme